MTGKPATEAQLRYLANLTTPDELVGMPASAARWLIDFLRGPPPNASRKQQLYLLGLISHLSREHVHELIGWLIERTQEPQEPQEPRKPAQSMPPQHVTGAADEQWLIDEARLPF